jgi:2-oxoglutarate dehydrogenase complex dehydrogenase (E1) component-like enzyme
MTPKSLLRLPAAASSLEELTAGGFQPIINDAESNDPKQVERIVLCSGKVFHDLNAARSSSPNVSEPGADRGPQPGSPAGVVDATGSRSDIAIIRVEQFYPFPLRSLTEAIAGYPNAKELVWCQEEPRNMGGWTFMESRLENLLPRCERARYIGRTASASPATGSYAIHLQEQERLVSEALSIRGYSSRAFASAPAR